MNIYKFASASDWVYIITVITTTPKLKRHAAAPQEAKKMNYSMGYEVHLVEKEIVMTKEFARQAAIFGTEEYARYMQLRAQYPKFTPVRYTLEPKATRESYSKLSYKSMELLIAEWFPGDKEALDEYESIKRKAKAYAGPYGYVKHWFLDKYREKYLSHKSANSANE